ncbi:unnamed protein product [Urochloa decumbens]|uniref:F-box domain-containing protein n=1 Tax=Urochloa decumbens TaxID=240449 RepID=A0ABC9FIM6_9POAL
MRARDAASSDRFPPDVLFNVLLRLPAKDLCRLRAVCRSGGDGDARWRGRQGPGLFIDKCSGVVVDGVVYFLTSRVYDDSGSGIRPDYIVSFDLGTEEWRRDLPGPISSSNAADMMWPFYLRRDLNLAGLNGSLVLADHHDRRTMDLWFLSDFENGLWVKEYHIQTGSIISRWAAEYRLKPLVLDDGRLVLYLASTGQLFICDPGTKAFAELDIRRLDSVVVYTGNLLGLGGADMV